MVMLIKRGVIYYHRIRLYSLFNTGIWKNKNTNIRRLDNQTPINKTTQGGQRRGNKITRQFQTNHEDVTRSDRHIVFVRICVL
jgi:hypothetical protein